MNCFKVTLKCESVMQKTKNGPKVGFHNDNWFFNEEVHDNLFVLPEFRAISIFFMLKTTKNMLKQMPKIFFSMSSCMQAQWFGVDA